MKCVAQIPQPLAAPAVANQAARARPFVGHRPMKQIDRRQACEKTDDPGETDQTQVVFEGQARQYAEHRNAPVVPRYRTKETRLTLT